MAKIDISMFDKYLGITDDVMFQNVMKNPDNCRMLLHEILPELKIEGLEFIVRKELSLIRIIKLQF